MKLLYALVALLTIGCSTPRTRTLINPIDVGMGTAFNLRYKDTVYGVTAAHVCRKAGANGLAYQEGDAIKRVKIIAQDNGLDLCVMERVPGITPINLSASSEAPDTVFALGYPLNADREITSSGEFITVAIQPQPVPQEDNGKCALGSIAKGKNEEGEDFCFVLTFRAVATVPIYPGNSGGPVLDKKGDVVGVALEIDLPDGSPTRFLPGPAIAMFLDTLHAEQ